MAPVSISDCHVTKGHQGPGVGSKRIDDREDNLGTMIDAATIENKIDFFRFIGLETSKSWNVNCINGNNEKVRESKGPNVAKGRESLSATSKNDELKLSCRTSGKCDDEEGHFVDDSRDAPVLVRECRVRIIGERCRLCRRSFKCIRDLQSHDRKKHRRRKPRARVTLKIGDEVISSVHIRRKHLKRPHREAICHEEDPKIINTGSEPGHRVSSYHHRDEETLRDARVTPLIDLEDICDIKENGSTLTRIADDDVILSPLGVTCSSIDEDYELPTDTRRDNGDDDEDIREVLRITRPPKSLSAINHETPNRFERELLLSDALREFDRLESCGIDAIRFVETNRHIDDDIIEDYCWLSDRRMANRRLRGVENNCSFDIKNDDCDVDFTLDGPDSLAKYFDDENASLPYEEYRKENGDVVPDFIDYSHSLDYSHPLLNDNRRDNNNIDGVYDMESQFYNEERIDDWKKRRNADKSIRQRVKENVDPSNFIKEEVILEDLLR